MTKTPGSKMKQPSKSELRQIIADQAAEIRALESALSVLRQQIDGGTCTSPADAVQPTHD